MKKKIILMIIISIILSMIIYIYTKNNKINILSLGDSISLGLTPYNIKGYSFNDLLKENYQENHLLNNYYEYSSSGKTVKELIYEIKSNNIIEYNNNKINIQRAINIADIITISIGMDELSEDKITSDIIKDYKNDLEELLSMIKVLNKNKVIVLGLYTINNQEKLNIYKLNSIIEDLSIKNNFIYIDISTILEETYFFNNKDYYLNYLGNKRIYEEIKKSIVN